MNASKGVGFALVLILFPSPRARKICREKKQEEKAFVYRLSKFLFFKRHPWAKLARPNFNVVTWLFGLKFLSFFSFRERPLIDSQEISRFEGHSVSGLSVLQRN